MSQKNYFSTCIVCNKPGQGITCLDCLKIGINKCMCGNLVRKNEKCSCENNNKPIDYNHLLIGIIEKYKEKFVGSSQFQTLKIKLPSDVELDLSVPDNITCNELLYLVHHKTSIGFENLLMTHDDGQICSEFNPMYNGVVYIQLIQTVEDPYFIICGKEKTSTFIDLNQLDDNSVKSIIWQHTNKKDVTFERSINKTIVVKN